MPRLSLNHFRKLKRQGEKFASLTAYDASFAHLIEEAGIELVLVGDSLGMVIQGHESTLPVSIEEMIYHAQQVHRGSDNMLLMVDMPFMSYATPDTALHNAARLMREGYAQVVKLEGGNWLVDTVKLLTERGIPVCAHLGLMPQSVHQLGGYVVQGRANSDAERLRQDALALQAAGASMLLVECIPGKLAAEITQALHIPVIGIGAGAECDGQILVLYDMLGLTVKPPSFSKNFLTEQYSIQAAVQAYTQAVKSKAFPTIEQTFT
ncbi:3-methyl-2-oxobutanoate hydroxymethyltransferase [Beggiatoa leptomitoformis]|uniref:3-methyl-2-oxobutanoate hydroxymethyltransferase n=1 Tax=Beggiatoa leptomitoformis TaxID=288004 RepID=A0A2N9YHQ3_9GAMM|nr:3-methyl-2-oxobutanoate hydroxymethyltransferase [Beggiatoa leptomitoformis]ALG67816.1 3-methyl-2-oxobutanoate hydroxymethyltransferase [Beggiatoa leptomitoformis]AUI69929.1 3-methyl-2-oxobutanoate hydroxymethyltransferase [Beggiatoa leptomitoformis]